MDHTFPSKRDRPLTAAIWAGAAALVVCSFIIWALPTPWIIRLGMSTVPFGSALFCVWILYSTAYSITDTELRVRSGPFRWRIPLEEIAEVIPSNDWRSSPACSLDRLQIRRTCRKPDLLISPAQKRSFLKTLGDRCPHLNFREGRPDSAGQ